MNTPNKPATTARASISRPCVLICCALAAEAKPIQKALSLKLKPMPQAMPGSQKIFSNADDSIILIITGVGIINAASGCATLAAVCGWPRHAWLINIGIAGHKSAEIGNILRADQIFSPDTINQTESNKKIKNTCYYPGHVLTKMITGATCQTNLTPSNEYNNSDLNDMEASAIVQTGCQWLTREQIEIIKVVSDTPAQPIKHVDKNFVSSLIEKNIDIIISSIETCLEASKVEALYYQKPNLEPWLEHCHWTETQKHKLADILRRWDINFQQEQKNNIEHSSEHRLRNIRELYKTAKEILKHMDTKLRENLYDWDENNKIKKDIISTENLAKEKA